MVNIPVGKFMGGVALVTSLRASEINKYPKVAPGFGPNSRRTERGISGYSPLSATPKSGRKTSRMG